MRKSGRSFPVRSPRTFFRAISRPSYRRNPKEGRKDRWTFARAQFTTQSALAGFPPDVAKGWEAQVTASLPSRSLYRLIKLMDTYYRGLSCQRMLLSTSIDPSSPVSASAFWNSSTLKKEGILIRIRRNLGSFDFLARLIDWERKDGAFCTIASLFSGGIFALSRLKNSVNEKWFFSSMKIIR